MGFDKYGSDGHLYEPGVDEALPPESIEEQVKKLTDALLEAFRPVFDQCRRIVQNLVDALTPQIQILGSILEQYPDKRIVWLALHHKKERVRKKNINRILKWIERNGKCGNKTNR